MTYTWQHFKAIEYGYKIEFMKNERNGLSELNRTLRLEEASLRSPDRIDRLARQYRNATAPGGPGDPHGFHSAGCRLAGDGQRIGIGDFGSVRLWRTGVSPIHGKSWPRIYTDEHGSVKK